MKPYRHIRELQKEDAYLVVDYFHGGSRDFLWNMGVDPGRLLPRQGWIDRIANDMDNSIEEREFYYVLWEIDSTPVGHSNINQIKYGKEAHMHLHIWKPEARGSGNGAFFVKRSVQQYFRVFQLQQLYCAPNWKNEAPNKTLARAGFTFLEKYEGVPGRINYKQYLNKWIIRKDQVTFD